MSDTEFRDSRLRDFLREALEKDFLYIDDGNKRTHVTDGNMELNASRRDFFLKIADVVLRGVKEKNLDISTVPELQSAATLDGKKGLSREELSSLIATYATSQTGEFSNYGNITQVTGFATNNVVNAHGGGTAFTEKVMTEIHGDTFPKFSVKDTSATKENFDAAVTEFNNRSNTRGNGGGGRGF